MKTTKKYANLNIRTSLRRRAYLIVNKQAIGGSLESSPPFNATRIPLFWGRDPLASRLDSLVVENKWLFKPFTHRVQQDSPGSLRVCLDVGAFKKAPIRRYQGGQREEGKDLPTGIGPCFTTCYLQSCSCCTCGKVEGTQGCLYSAVETSDRRKKK